MQRADCTLQTCGYSVDGDAPYLGVVSDSDLITTPPTMASLGAVPHGVYREKFTVTKLTMNFSHQSQCRMELLSPRANCLSMAWKLL